MGEGGQESEKEAKCGPTGCQVEVSKCKPSLYTQCCFLSWCPHRQNRRCVRFEQKYYFSETTQTA